MAKVDVLIEVFRQEEEAFVLHNSMLTSTSDSVSFGESLVQGLSGFGLEIKDDIAPVPLFFQQTVEGEAFSSFAAFASPETNPDIPAQSFVVSASLERSSIETLKTRSDVRVFLNSELTLFSERQGESSAVIHPFDLVSSAGGIDCRPFSPAVDIAIIRQLLGVDAVWRDGFGGQNIVVGIIDEGVNGAVYPVVGGFSKPNAQRPGTASIQSHGSMCAAGILVAAPLAKIYDYPFLEIPNSGGALQMFQAVLEQRRVDGTPHLLNNSYGFVGVPLREEAPNHEIWDINHPLHRKIREVIASGASAFFAAGNCGENCPSANCRVSGIGPGRSIHASNALAEVITVAAVNSQLSRIGYSSQGPGMFERDKPDLAAYSHYFGNYGPGRPAGTTTQPFDSGTSAASPVAAGVAALLMSAVSGLTPAILKKVLMETAIDIGKPGFDFDTGRGVINAAAAYSQLKQRRC
jgi:subtilisin family serine protease